MASKSSSNKGAANRGRLARRSVAKRPKKPSAKRPQKPAPPAVASPVAPAPPPSAAGVLKVSRPALARLMGVHEDTVSKFSRKGMPVLTVGGHGTESWYDAFACLAWQREQQPMSAKDAAQARLFEANAVAAEMRLKRDRGLLVSRESVERAGQAIVAGIRAKVLSLPVRLRHQGFITRDQEAGVRELCRGDLKDIETWEVVAHAIQLPPVPPETQP